MENLEDTLLLIENVKKYYLIRAGLWKKEAVKAVDGVSMQINEGGIYCIVGESGSGKSTLGRLMVGLEEPTEGNLLYQGTNLPKIRKNRKKWKIFRREVQMIFQNPDSSLNPRKKIRYILSKPFKIHGIEYNEDDLKESLSKVGLTPPSEYLNKYPHELSGGQKQRIAIARALTLRPKLIVLDEPTSELDVTTKVQIIDLLNNLQKEEKMTLIFISHELPFLKPLKGIVFVMYNGVILEEGTTEDIFNNMYHPYTIGLLNSILELDPKEAKKKGIFAMEGEAPSPINPPSGCRFHPRCPLVKSYCKASIPHMVYVSRYHKVACPIALEIFKDTSINRASIYYATILK